MIMKKNRQWVRLKVWIIIERIKCNNSVYIIILKIKSIKRNKKKINLITVKKEKKRLQ
jgi:hypothetical protein